MVSLYEPSWVCESWVSMGTCPDPALLLPTHPCELQGTLLDFVLSQVLEVPFSFEIYSNIWRGFPVGMFPTNVFSGLLLCFV